MHFLADRKRFENASKLAHSILEGCESRSFFTFLAGGFLWTADVGKGQHWAW